MSRYKELLRFAAITGLTTACTDTAAQPTPTPREVAEESASRVEPTAATPRYTVTPVPTAPTAAKEAIARLTATPRSQEARPSGTPGVVVVGETEKGLVYATLTPEPARAAVIEKGGIRVFGVPDRATNVDIARGEFRNTLGLGTEAVLAEPGGLLVGPDFFDRQGDNPLGQNSRGADTMYESKGHIKPFSAVTQEVVRWPGEAWQNLPEGGFVFFSAGQMTVEIVGADGNVRARFEMPHKGGNHNYFFIARGLYPEGTPLTQDSDRNLRVRITQYVPGHTELEMYEAGNNTNTAFISEGQFLQKARMSQRSGTNCGAGGCSKLTAVMFDTNTGAFAVVEHSGNRDSDPRQGWRSVTKNF